MYTQLLSATRVTETMTTYFLLIFLPLAKDEELVRKNCTPSMAQLVYCGLLRAILKKQKNFQK